MDTFKAVKSGVHTSMCNLLMPETFTLLNSIPSYVRPEYFSTLFPLKLISVADVGWPQSGRKLSEATWVYASL